MTDTIADVVIVGAGSAGCVVANRLSEDPSMQVLLLEAGVRGPSVLSDVPGLTMRLMGNPKMDWCHAAEPDPTLNGRTLTWHAGKMLGGGSGMNGLVYIRCGPFFQTGRALRGRRSWLSGSERSAVNIQNFLAAQNDAPIH